MKIKTFFTALFILIAFVLSAQNNTEGESFQLTKKGAHYVFTASINGTADATILVESGIPALLADSAFVFSSGILSDMELTVADKEKLNLAGRIYKITHKANGTVRIGNNTSYIGDVFVLSNYDYGPYEVAVPIRNCCFSFTKLKKSKGFLQTTPTWNCGRQPLRAVRWWGNLSSQNSANSAVSLSLTQWWSSPKTCHCLQRLATSA